MGRRNNFVSRGTAAVLFGTSVLARKRYCTKRKNYVGVLTIN